MLINSMFYTFIVDKTRVFVPSGTCIWRRDVPWLELLSKMEECQGTNNIKRHIFIAFLCNLFQNQTRIFNLYGITEVSCWATCHEVNPLSLSTHTSSNRAANMVPIGECLLDTCIELRDQSEADGGIEGSLWIGQLQIIQYDCHMTLFFFRRM